eukprot:gnl/Hemi2/16451_TR5492_c0_g1_i1.p1 gnl/Hemi2/16451_TR5492_c0_g1~~gnl/Hemi2/16451_TR5492_c0_g1_i1.p1  ORF type:complete len:376 (+),score=32.38 gnl/Hemi2/16451_TR5492_c0_g1_i1:106-1233(+)
MPQNGPLTVHILDPHSRPLKEFVVGDTCYVVATLGQPFSVSAAFARSETPADRPLLVECEVDGCASNIPRKQITTSSSTTVTFNGFLANGDFSNLYQFCFAQPARSAKATAAASASSGNKIGTVKVDALFAKVVCANAPPPKRVTKPKPAPVALNVQEDKKFWLTSASVSAGSLICNPSIRTAGPSCRSTGGLLASVTINFATADALLLMHVLSYDNPEHAPYLPPRPPARQLTCGLPREIVLILDDDEAVPSRGASHSMVPLRADGLMAMCNHCRGVQVLGIPLPPGAIAITDPCPGASATARKRVKREEDTVQVCDLTPRKARWSSVKKPRLSPATDAAMMVLDPADLCTTPSTPICRRGSSSSCAGSPFFSL